MRRSVHTDHHAGCLDDCVSLGAGLESDRFRGLLRDNRYDLDSGSQLDDDFGIYGSGRHCFDGGRKDIASTKFHGDLSSGRALWGLFSRPEPGFEALTASGAGAGGAGCAWGIEVTGTHASGDGSHLMRSAGINQKPSSRAAWNATAMPNHSRRRLRSKRRLLTLASVVGNNGTLCTYPEGGGKWIGPRGVLGRISGNFVT